jgi:hypothetical protein
MKLKNLIAVSALLGLISYQDAVNALAQGSNLENTQTQLSNEESDDEISDSDDS